MGAPLAETPASPPRTRKAGPQCFITTGSAAQTRLCWRRSSVGHLLFSLPLFALRRALTAGGWLSLAAEHPRERVPASAAAAARLPGSGSAMMRGLTAPWSVGSTGSGVEPVSLALAGGFFTSEPPGKPSDMLHILFSKKENGSSWWSNGSSGLNDLSSLYFQEWFEVFKMNVCCYTTRIGGEQTSPSSLTVGPALAPHTLWAPSPASTHTREPQAPPSALLLSQTLWESCLHTGSLVCLLLTLLDDKATLQAPERLGRTETHAPCKGHSRHG